MVVNIGVLALQGSVEEHCRMIKKSGDSPILVRYPRDLDNIQGLIIPGGESTTLLKLLKIKKMDEAITLSANKGLPIWGTCAGLILLSSMNIIDIEIRRNGFGSQAQSFDGIVGILDKKAFVRFIRAPRIISLGAGVTCLSRYNSEIVAAVSNKIMVTTFHPEVTEDKSFYSYFKSLVISGN